MERNLKSGIVVMDRDIYNTLRHYAAIGASEAGGCIEHVEKHVRRWNAEVSDDYQLARHRQRETFEKGKAAVQALLRSHCGKTVFIKTAREVLSEARLLSAVKGNKLWVRVEDSLDDKVKELHISEVFAELPEGYRKHMIGRWAGQYVSSTKEVDQY